MLFDQKEFEYKIAEAKLKKGLKFFDQKKVELINRSATGEFIFLVRDQIPAEVLLKKKGEKILSYSCSCRNKIFCEHLAASLFYLQEGFLELTKKQRSQRRKSEVSGKSKNEFENYLKKIKTTLRSFLIPDKLKEKDLNELLKKINSERTVASALRHDFYFDLALILQLHQVINFNTQIVLEPVIKNSVKNLEAAYNKGLSKQQTEAWILAAEQSLRSQTYFRTGMFYYLISKIISRLKDKRTVENLLTAIKKRKESKNNLSPISKKLIVEIELSILLADFSDKKYVSKNYENTLELPIALSEIEFAKKNNYKGFKLLENYAEKIRSKNINRYLDLVEHILSKAQEKNNKALEKYYLAEKFIYGYYIDSNELKNYFVLTDTEQYNNAASKLIKEIKARSVFYTFDKVADILFFCERYEELIGEIKKEKNKFTLLHKIALQRAVKWDNGFLLLYAKQLVQAIVDAKFPYFQQEVFNKAKLFLDILPLHDRNSVIKIVKEKMLYDKQMLQYIEKVYQ